MSEVNVNNFVNEYLTVLGVPGDQLKEATTKIFSTAILYALRNQQFNETQTKNIKDIELLLVGGKEQDVVGGWTSILGSLDKENLQKSFFDNMMRQLLGMTDKIGDTLTEEKKKQLAELINSLV